jgi:hypothetical protein
VRFYEVPEDELEGLRTDFRNGRLDIRIERATFSVHEYNEVGWCGCGCGDVVRSVRVCGVVVLPL